MKNVGGGVFESLDKGKTWKRISAVSQYNIVSNDISGEKGSLFSASTVFYKGDTKRPYEEVNFSKDGGNTWTKIGSDKLPGNIQVENLFATKTHLYIASSAHGIWTLPISELYPPIVITKDFINKTATSVTLTGTGSAERFESDFSFEYSEDPALKSGVTTVPLPATPKLGATIPLSAELKSLKASTIYYYRVVGINSGKVRSEGEIKAFETEALTTILTQKVPKDSWVEAASVGGVVNSPSVAVILNNKYHKQTKVNLRTRGLRRSSFDEPIPLTSTGSEFQAMLPADKFDELGLEYYFEVIPPEGFGKRDTTQAITLAIRYPAGKQIDGLSFKNKQYQLLSFPLELDDPTVGKVFGDELPLVKEPLQKDKWRLVIYEGKKSIKDLQTNDRLTPGVGYFLATTEAIILPINTGSGKTVAHHPDFKRNYFEITLKENDWTLIGNPYLWEVKWDDILRANGNPNWKLVTFAGGNLDYKATSIPPFSGGYVKHTAGAPLTLKIPTGSKGERRSAELKSEETMPLLVDFTINNGTNRTHLSGIGLHPSAKAGLDPYDLEMPPILGGFPCLRFASTDQTGQSLTRSILSPMEAGQVWEFSMSEGEASQVVNLSWETLKNEEGKQLWLHDLSSENKVDMISNPSYSFQGKGRFRVYYGTENYITEHLYPEKNLLQAYPNPFAQKTTLRFTLPHSNADYQVRMNLYDLQGRKLGTVVEGAYSNGFHQVEIPLGELPAGAYTVEATFDGERLHTVQRLKLIRQ